MNYICKTYKRKANGFIMIKKNIAVVCGGFSGESKVSMKGASNIINNIDGKFYNSYKVLISKYGWYVELNNKKYTVDKNDFSCIINKKKIKFDCAFVIIHGTPGEDGKLQGYFDLIGIPYTTSNMLVLAMTFNKNVCNNYVKQFGILIPETLFFERKDNIDIKKIISKFGLPLIVKPNNSGSSIGNSLVKTERELKPAINNAFKIDDEILIQEYIKGREITCGVLKKGNNIITFPLTEIITKRDYFDYKAKYGDKLTKEITPAGISGSIEKECKRISAMLFGKLKCKGLSRFDYILKDGKLYFLEVNTVPGMSAESIIPGQIKTIGMPMKELISTLIKEASK
ncbi:MAG: D-alanine--D-alanine ligase [Bacteroidales bacterium]|nr:D-alanine--D-alanine ligase [Bacteroidales bacterium]